MRPSKYYGVSYDFKKFQFKVTLMYEGRIHTLGWCYEEREGAIMRDKKILELGLSSNRLQILKPVKNEKNK